MGLASSQARLLLITSRKSDLEYRATQITQRKLLLATKSEQVATDYSKAVANKSWVMNTFDAKGNASQVPMNYSTLKTSGFVVKDSSGKTVSDKYSYTMTSSAGTKEPVSLGNLINSGYRVVDASGSILVNSYSPVAQDLLHETSPNGTSMLDLVKIRKAELAGNSITTGGYTYSPAQNNADFAQQKLESGEWKVQQKAANGSYVNVNLASFTTIDGTKTTNKAADFPTYLAQKLESGEWHIENPKAADNKVVDLNSDAQFSQILDESDDTAAEAKYQSESLKLQNQDKQLDLELKQIETQHKALETEYDSVKKVMDKNIDVSFKIFAQG